MTTPSSSPAPVPVDPLPRRTFFERLTTWGAGVVGALAAVALAVPVIGYFLGPLRKSPGKWVKLGPVSNFPKGQTRLATFVNPLGQGWDGVTAETGVYVRYQGKDTDGADQFLIFAINCAHLGCPVSWFPQSGLFMCPCHGGVYYETGEHASGPPPRGLFHCAWHVKDGVLEVEAPHYPTLHNTLTKKV